jgi:formylglycine-generating enzyme required for sulfatase activity
MGCRLPTSAEWKAAVTAGVSGAQNLRDPTWRKQYEKSKELAGSQPDYPAERIFWPAEAQKVPPMQDGFAAVDADDSVLWFAPVGGGPTFQHLIGNVAEFVWEDPAVLEGLEPTSARVKAALGKGEKLKVIGGSALSHKDIAVGEPQAVNFSQAREGYSDVGFRVAFTVPKGAGSGGGEKLDEALAAARYLTGE